jgi:aldehyde:ferredoxin oxidoreductase
MHGYHGRYLRIDPEPGRTALVPLPERDLRAFVGGVGLGTLLMARETPAGADPLGPDAALVFALSPLVGTPLTTSAKFAAVAISPLTGRVCDALSSSHFALAAKRAGVDAIALKGHWPEWVALFVESTGDGDTIVTPRTAAHLSGLSAQEAEDAIRREHGADWQVASIGPAGEALIPFATISHDGRHAGRGGLGAVLGSKRVKALAVRGDLRTTLADPERTVALARDLSARSFGPATEKYRELGTVANLLTFNRFDALPTRNFAAGSFASVGRLAAEDLAPARRIARQSCASCTIGCEHVYAKPRGGGVRLEYESLYALGPLCGVDDPAAVLAAASACDAQGLDTISTGGTIAFLMDCGEHGLIDPTLPSGRLLRFGDGEAVAEAVGLVARREGLGELIALGSRRASERIGGEARSLAVHVKGMELPGYDPRSLQTMALGLAVGTRGADHNRSGAYEADFSNRADRRRGGPDSAAPAIETEDRAALIDSLILCKFLRGVFDDLHAESAAMLAAVAGWDADAEELRRVARRVVNARKLVNLREGWTAAEDTLPPRLLLDMPDAPDAPGLPRARLEGMVASYYKLRGWDAEGRVPDPLRLGLGLDDPAFGAGGAGRA